MKREFKACRINGQCYLEEFRSGRAVRLVAERRDIPKRSWNKAYQEFVLLAETLNDRVKDIQIDVFINIGLERAAKIAEVQVFERINDKRPKGVETWPVGKEIAKMIREKKKKVKV